MIRRWKAAHLALALTALAFTPGCAGQMYVHAGPPPVRVEVVEVRPGVEFVWITGYWGWNRHEYYWVPGHWVRPPRRGARWIPGHWVESHRGWYWIDGRWR